ncbi:MAG: alpha/beta fold hydrolase [Candidatus Dormiibacterota bacterium]
MDELRVLSAGEPLEQATAAMVMAHGRGASAEDILLLSQELATPGFAYLAPQAPGNTWYPNRYSAPIESNEPWLSRALATIDAVVAEAEAHLPAERIMLLGFSQGACLTLEYAARHARRHGGIAGLSGALIGPRGTPRDYPGSFDGTPTFLGCSDTDPHVVADDVALAAEVLQRMGAEVTVRLYPLLGHTINADEVAEVRRMMAPLVSA